MRKRDVDHVLHFQRPPALPEALLTHGVKKFAECIKYPSFLPFILSVARKQPLAEPTIISQQN